YIKKLVFFISLFFHFMYSIKSSLIWEDRTMTLQVANLSHSFGDRTLFKDVSFRLLPGDHAGLVGANGVGKSTIMNIITGQLIHDTGTYTWTPKIQYGYLDQHTVLASGKTIRDILKDAFLPLFTLEKELTTITEKMADATPEELEVLLEQMGDIQDRLDAGGFYMIDVQVEEIAHGLGLDAIGLERDVASLSGGQRTKVLLAKLLLEKPQVLLLDEPTNYLDVEHIQWLRTYLQEYPGAFILISHDIPFLNSVINLIYHMENQQVTRYPGDYDEFLRVHEMRQQQVEAAYKKQQKEISHLKDFVARNK